MYGSKYVCTYMQMYVCLHVHICVCVSYVLELNSSSCRYTADMLAHTSFKSNGCLFGSSLYNLGEIKNSAFL